MSRPLEHLRAIVDSGGTELDCRDAFIPLAGEFVARQLRHHLKEKPNHEGRTDLELIVEPTELQFESSNLSPFRRMLVFELKSPSAPMYKWERGAKRFVPSRELILAETQLLTYTQTLRENVQTYMRKYSVLDIKPCGIIIGTDRTQFNISRLDTRQLPSVELDASKGSTMRSRQEFIYERAGISVFTWTQIVTILHNSARSTFDQT